MTSQAGHVDVVSFLLNKVRTIVVDPVNNLGFSPLMKAALQGRIKCSKLLLFSGRTKVKSVMLQYRSDIRSLINDHILYASTFVMNDPINPK